MVTNTIVKKTSKNLIKLNETQLRKAIADSIEKVLNENKQMKNHPNIKTLGDGVYDGALWGHTFLYNGIKYYSETGWKNMYPIYCKATIKGNDVHLEQVDNYQRQSLVKDFE